MPTAALNIPNPDPSVRTQEQLERELNLLESKINLRIEALEKKVDEFKADLTRVPTLLDREISRVNEVFGQKINSTEDLVGERIHSITTQLQERDQRREGDKQAADAVQAKSEAGFTKQIENINNSISQGFKSLEDKIAINQTRITEISTGLIASRDRHAEGAMNTGSIVSLLTLGLIAVGMLVTVVVYVTGGKPTNRDLLVQPAPQVQLR